MMTPEEVRKAFQIQKEAENYNRSQSTVDILDTRNFFFSPICPNDYIGNSGSLLLAEHKTNVVRQLLVKHARLHAAANEFVYSKLVEAMDYAVPKAYLFQVAPEDRDSFETDFVIGSAYLHNAKTKPTSPQIREQADNWQDYFRLRAVFRMFLDSDGFEALLTEDGHLYRIDTAETFRLNESHILAAADIPFSRLIIRRHFIESRLLMDLHSFWDYSSFDEELLKCTRLDSTVRSFYLEPFEQIQSISQTYIDSFLHALCCIYPDLLGNYYRKFITTLQIISKDYLRTKG